MKRIACRSLAIIILISLLFLSLPAQGVSAAGFTVTKFTDTADGACDSDCSLREAIIAANASPGADTITLPAGTYVLSIVDPLDDASYGDLDINNPLTLNGAGSWQTIIDAADIDRVFDVYSLAGLVTLSGVTVTNGHNGGYGAGISCYQTSLSLQNVIVSHNDNTTTTYAGGIYASECDLDIAYSQISYNSAYHGAGLVALYSTVSLAYSNVSNNDSTGAGAGIYAEGTDLDLNYVALVNNSTEKTGGGLYFAGGTDATVVIANSLVADNQATEEAGGVAIMNGSTAILTNSTVSGNQAEGYGGGVEARIPLTITHSTIVHNVADVDADNDGYAGGLFVYGSTAQVSLSNTILAENENGANTNYYDCMNISGSLISSGYNLVQTPGFCVFSATGDITGQAPLLGPLANNGGPTWTHALLPGSPAFNAGDPAFTPPPMNDQRGVGYSRVVKGRLDIGAYEEQYRIFMPLIFRP